MITAFIAEDILKLIGALLIGIVIGAEREYRNKSAGFRTIILICVGSALFTVISQRVVGDPTSLSRITANIITGIGFLGAGAIFKDRDGNEVNGLTTAATIWITAALGMAMGMGHYIIAGFAALLALMVLWGFTRIQYFIDRAHRRHRYRIVCAGQDTEASYVEAIMKNCELEFMLRGLAKHGSSIAYTWEVQGQSANHDKLVQLMLKDALIAEFDY